MLHIGTTEGRFRMIMPDLMAAFEALCCKESGVAIRGYMADAVSLREQLVSGELDIAFSGLTPHMPPGIESRLLLDEQLFFVISENMLRKYRPDYLSDPGRSADLSDFETVPVCRSLPGLHCMQILDKVLEAGQVSLNCVHVSGHFDLHQELAVRDYAACFCLGMYLPNIKMINDKAENKLHVFRIEGLTDTNPVYLLQKKNHPSDPGREVFIRLLEGKCSEIAALQEEWPTWKE